MKYRVRIFLKRGTVLVLHANRVDFNYHCGVDIFKDVDSAPIRWSSDELDHVEIYIQ